MPRRQNYICIKSIAASSCSEHSLVFFSGLLVAMATAQMLGDRQGLFPERNRTQCPSPEVLRAAGCNINCIQRNMTSDEGCAYCNRTCNGLFVHNSTPNLLMVFYCPENCIENVCRVQQQLTSCFLVHSHSGSWNLSYKRPRVCFTRSNKFSLSLVLVFFPVYIPSGRI